MILPNNPRIDPEDVERHVLRVISRRRQTLMADSRQPRSRPRPGLPRLTLRQRLKGLPLLGPTLTYFYRRWRTVTTPGIGRRERIKALPLVGDLLYFLWVLRDLPRFRLATARDLDALRLEQERDRAQLQGLRQNLEQHRQATQQLAREWREQMDQWSERLAAHSLALRLLEQRPTAEPGEPTLAAVREGAVPLLGNFYLEFESRFRGSPAAIKERLRPYLPYLQQAIADVPAPRCVDIGCGRGEWLELLREQGLTPQGMDLDPGMVLACQDRGLDVRQGDGIAWLKTQAAGSLHVVSAFQVIEHLGFAQLLELLDATLHALAPGGIAIFETPNPENLIVGACNFHYDPTHQHPIPPPVAAFIAEQRGFSRVEILRLNPYPEAMMLPGDDARTRRLNDLLYGPQDYALIAGIQRPGHGSCRETAN